jgi:hypothetical protein
MRCKSLLFVAIFTVVPASLASAEPLVNCAEKRFQSGSKADSLLGWSNHYYKTAKKDADSNNRPPQHVCDQLISLRGDAYCQAPKNTTYRSALVDALAICPLPKKAKKAEDKKPVATAPSAGNTKPLVNCSEKRFQSRTSVRGLMSFSEVHMRDLKKGGKTGIYPEARCNTVIEQRGSAHCKELGNVEVRTKLKEVLDYCTFLRTRDKPKKRMLVDCKLERFSKKQSAPLMVKWATDMTSSLESWSAVAAEAKCQESYSFAGSAHCLLPNDESARNAVKLVANRCADNQDQRHAALKGAKEAKKKRLAEIKANRKMTKVPKSTYRGGGKKGLARSMKKALLAGRVAKSAKEIKRVQPMGTWVSGRFVDTKVRYKKISGLVVWADDDGDKVCRYTTYNFIKAKGGSLRFKSFCMGCSEGWTRCK